MKDSRREATVVTMRDEKLFRYLFVNKAATVQDIRRDIFGETKLKGVHKRLVKLSKAGFVEAVAQRERGNRMVYSLTKKGFRESTACEKEVPRVQLKSDSPDHDLALLEIKRALRRFPQDS